MKTEDTETGHILYFSREENQHKFSVTFLGSKHNKHIVLGCKRTSCRPTSTHIKASPFNITTLPEFVMTNKLMTLKPASEHCQNNICQNNILFNCMNI